MIINIKRKSTESEQPPNFWISYSDLLAGMLLVFALLLIVAMSNFASFNERKKQLLSEQETKLKSFRALQERLIGNLSEAMTDQNAQIDIETGVLQIQSGILFGEGESGLRVDASQRLFQIFDAYIKVILNDEFREFIKYIEIEGHTNSNGGYLYNLKLSQERALTIMRQLLDHASASDRQMLEKMVVASGRAYSNLILDQQGREDLIKSRRIEIKFRLKESELFDDIYRELVRE